MFEQITRSFGQFRTNMSTAADLTSPQESGWAICRSDDMSDAIEFSVFMNMDTTNEFKITQSPVENGDFVSYNKTSSPAVIGLQVAIKGTHDEIMSALTDLEVLAAGTDLITIITPDNVYSDYNIVKFQYSRKVEDGIDIVYCDIGFEEVRQVESQYTNTKLPKTQNKGRQQAKTPSGADAKKVKQNGPQSFGNMTFNGKAGAAIAPIFGG